jgi:hypothetical protein
LGRERKRIALAVIVNSNWIYLAGFVGLGLTFAGLTDICAMGELLAKVLWNRARVCAFSAAKLETATKATVAEAMAGR